MNERLLNKLSKINIKDKKVVITWDRACTITPEMVGFTVGVHNGRTHVPVLLVENMVGHKLGEFAPTRKFVRHGGKMAKEQAKEETAPAAAAPKPAPVAKAAT